MLNSQLLKITTIKTILSRHQLLKMCDYNHLVFNLYSKG